MSSLTKEMVEEWLKNSISQLTPADSENNDSVKAAVLVFTVNKDVDSIDKDAFLPLSYIDHMILNSESSEFPVENNCLFSAKGGRLYFAAGAEDSSEEEIKLPSQIKEVNLYAFPAGVHKIEVPAAVPEIPIKAAKAADLKSFIEQRNQKVKAKREKIQAIMRLKQGK